MVKVRDICLKDVVVATGDMTVAAAAQLMRRHHVGTIIVCGKGNGARRVPVGIVTDRDIVVEVVAPELRADTITVGDIMVEDLITVRETDDVLKAVKLMRQKGVRRLPVVKANGHLVGIVSADDLAGALPAELGNIAMVAARGRAREAAQRR